MEGLYHVDVVNVDNCEELNVLWDFFHFAGLVNPVFRPIDPHGIWPIVIYLYSDSGRYEGWDHRCDFERQIRENGYWRIGDSTHVPSEDKEFTCTEYMKMLKGFNVSVDADYLMSIL